jgi:hypothetical protein
MGVIIGMIENANTGQDRGSATKGGEKEMA